jgi:hypothetical protein
MSFVKNIIKKGVACVGRRHPEWVVRTRYLLRFHRRLNLKHPSNLNEKIQFLSLRTDTSEWTRLTDKYAVRDFVRERDLERTLVKLYGVWDDADSIDFDALPSQFVLKCTHGSGDCIIVRDKSLLDILATRASLQQTLSETYGLAEGNLHYSRIQPRVMAEELLCNDEEMAAVSSSLVDYKIWCFNGKAHYIWACSNRTKTSVRVMTYDTSWNAHPEYSIFNVHYQRDKLMPRPHNLTEMLAVAEKLSEGFPVVRVDLYSVEGEICFGEMTFTSLGGLMNYYTPEFLIHAGSLINLNA